MKTNKHIHTKTEQSKKNGKLPGNARYGQFS